MAGTGPMPGSIHTSMPRPGYVATASRVNSSKALHACWVEGQALLMWLAPAWMGTGNSGLHGQPQEGMSSR